MKKFLLSLAVMALGVLAMNAEVYNVNDATDIDGTLVEEVNTDKAQTAKHYQPLNSFKLGAYTLAFTNGGNTGATNQPAYYYNMSTSTNTQNTIRLYKQNTLTISSETGFGKIVITADKITALNETNMVTASVGGFTVDPTAKTLTWINSETVKTVTFTMPAEKVNGANPQVRIISFDITSETGDVPVAPDPVIPDGSKFQLVENIDNAGQYVFVANNKYGVQFPSTKNYGYWSTAAADVTEDSFVGDVVNAIVISAVEGKEGTYTMKDSSNRYLGQDLEHKNTFQLVTDAADAIVGCEWTITFNADKKVIVTNTKTGRQVMQDPQYGSFGCYKDAEIKDTFVLPQLFKAVAGDSAVDEIEAEVAGEAVYYNLQGVRVAEPENGIYIKVQGNKATKVLVRK